MPVLLLLHVLTAPFAFQQGGIAFELDQPSDWVIEACDQDSLVVFSQRDGLASLSVNVFEDLMWSDALDVFSEGTREFLDVGYILAGKSRLTMGELRRAAANDGARFHYIKRDGEIKEHIFIMVAVHENLVLLLTFYLPRWLEDHERLIAVQNIMASFHFQVQTTNGTESIPPAPPLK